jgi:hypothetical protein
MSARRTRSEPQHYTVAAAARLLGVSGQSVRRWVARHLIDPVSVEGDVQVLDGDSVRKYKRTRELARNGRR